MKVSEFEFISKNTYFLSRMRKKGDFFLFSRSNDHPAGSGYFIIVLQRSETNKKRRKKKKIEFLIYTLMMFDRIDQMALRTKLPKKISLPILQ